MGTEVVEVKQADMDRINIFSLSNAEFYLSHIYIHFIEIIFFFKIIEIISLDWLIVYIFMRTYFVCSYQINP